MNYGFEQLKDLIRRNGGAYLSDSVVSILAAIGLAESAGDATVRRYCSGNGYCQITRNGRTTLERAYPNQAPEDSIGLWQINRFAWGGSPQLYSDPNVNAQVAIEAYKKQGFNAWKNTYLSGKWKKYLGLNSEPSDNSAAVSPTNSQPVFDSSVTVIGSQNRYLIAVIILVIIFVFAFN